MKKLLTLTLLLTDDAICLAMKKRGFGVGNWNGFGGKVEDGESLRDAAVREVKEESGVTINTGDLEEVACIDFTFQDGNQLEVHAYMSMVWAGEPHETEEMQPKWFHFEDIPYDSMWAADRVWIPRVLYGEKLKGEVYFDEDGKTVKEMKWVPTVEFDESLREMKWRPSLR